LNEVNHPSDLFYLYPDEEPAVVRLNQSLTAVACHSAGDEH
jgi:hypothetical protein